MRTSKRAEVDSVIEGLNALFGRGPAVTQDITAAQASCHAHLLKVCCRIDCSSFLTRPREAVRLLLGSALHDYGVDASSTFRPYNVSKLSLPAQLTPVELASISKEIVKIVGDPEVLLEPDDVAREKVLGSKIVLYRDKVIAASRKAYVTFLSSLCSASMLTWVRRPLGLITPFFVEKKSGMIRLVWDCRLVNLLFRWAPHIDLGSLDCLSNVDLSSGHSMWISQADVKNCFCQVKLPQWLIPYFALIL